MLPTANKFTVVYLIHLFLVNYNKFVSYDLQCNESYSFLHSIVFTCDYFVISTRFRILFHSRRGQEFYSGGQFLFKFVHALNVNK